VALVDRILRRKRDFEIVFRGTGTAGERVLGRLAKFCGETKTLYDPDGEMATGIRIGRHDVILMIREILDLTPEQIRRAMQADQQEEKQNE